MPQTSAGLLMYRTSDPGLEVFLVHPGGPFWAKKNEGVWSVPKGLIDEGEDKLLAAIREFTEETSFVPSAPYLELGELHLKSGKLLCVWAFEGNCDPSQLRSNTFTLEWPPKSRRRQEFPEVDRGAFFELSVARFLINPSQLEFLDRLREQLRV